MTKQQSVRILSEREGLEESKPKNYYLWGYQPHFCIEVEIAAKALFAQLDETIVPDTFLVAINTEEGGRHPRAVVEPHDHEFKHDDFTNVLQLALEYEKAVPGPSYGYPVGSKFGEQWAERERRRDFRQRIRHAIVQTVEGASPRGNTKVYLSSGRDFGDFIVFSALLLDKSKYDSHPHLHKIEDDGYSVVPSLLDAVAKEFLNACWTAILSSFEGQAHSIFPPADSMLRAAANLFMYTPFGACRRPGSLHGGFEICNEISTMTYEGISNRSNLILARQGHEKVLQTIAFQDPPRLRNYRGVRKLLQLSHDDEGLVCDSHQITGIGKVLPGYNTADEDLFCVAFLGHSKWELKHNGISLMRVEYGLPQLPRKRQQVQRFMEMFDRLFPGTSQAHQTAMKRIATAMVELDHGAVLVINKNAANEASRFGNQCTRIGPQPLNIELLGKASRIDGAMLASPDGSCHAIGVILDGQVNNKGSAERGARFNSTVRYVHDSKSPCVGLVMSDDGMVDIVPEYRPVASRNAIDRMLDDLRSLAAEGTIDTRHMSKIMDRIYGNSFYLSQEQCDEINNLVVIAETKLDNSTFRRVYQKIQPHPEMNESFLRS